MDDAMFLIPTPQVLQKIITGLEDLYENDISDLDMQGDLYEYMLGKLATAWTERPVSDTEAYPGNDGGTHRCRRRRI